MKKLAFIVWARYHRRSDLLAQHFGASIHYVYYGEMGKFLQTPVRYLMQTLRTWQILRRERPDVIFVQNPPIFAAMVVAFYALFHRANYIIDSHTGAFLAIKWGWSVGLHRILSRSALTTIVHNDSQGNLVRQWGCPYCVLGFTPGAYSAGVPYPLIGKFNVAVICSFDADEPLDVLFEAANRLGDVNFHLTGDARRIDRRLLEKKPENIHLTGYLPYENYIGLLRGVDTIVDLVNNDHTLLMGGFEAVSLGVPLIVSDSPLLRNYFSRGTVYVSNTIEGICEGLKRTQADHLRLRDDMALLRNELQAEWDCKSAELQSLLEKI